MDLTIPDRIHIVPLGYEEDRVFKTANRLKANYVILLRHNGDTNDDAANTHFENVCEGLRENEIEYDVKKCDLFDMYGSLGEISQLIVDNQKEEVFVNLSTGSKVTAIAGMIACMATGEATPYYVRAEKYAEIPVGVDRIDKLPAYHIQPPKPEQIKILDLLNSNGPSTKRELIEYGNEYDLPFYSEHQAEEFKARYPVLASKIINPLSERGCLNIQEQGRKKKVNINKRGKDTLRAFKYLISN